MAQLQADLGCAAAVHKVHDAREGALLRIVPQAGASGCDAAFGCGAGHLHHHQRCATQGARTQVHQVEVLWHALDRAVGGHGRDDDAVLEREVFQGERREHGRNRRFAACEPGLVALQPCRIAQPQVLVADALAAREQRIRELLDGHAGVARHVFKPFGAVACGVLDLEHLHAAARLVVLQHLIDGQAGRKLIGQVDGIFQRQLGAAADGEMRRVRGIAHQHDRHLLAANRFAVHPGIADHTRKTNPVGRAAQVRGVADEGVAVQVLREELFAKRNRLGLLHGVQAMGLPHGLGRLDDEGGGVGVELVGVGLEPAILGLFEREGEGVELLLGAQPHEAALAQVDVGLVNAGVTGADAAVEAVAGDDQVGVVLRGERLVVGHVGLKHQLHAQLQAPVLQDVEQPLAANAAKAVAGGAHAAALEKHLDVVPVVERIADERGRGRVGGLQVGQRLVGQHHAPAEGVERSVALDHRDAVGGILLLHQQGEIETAANAEDVHVKIV